MTMSAPARRSSPTLPGAWSSTWTLNQVFETNEETNHKLSESAKIDHTIQKTDNSPPVLSKSPSLSGSNRSRRTSHSTFDDQASGSTSYDDESITSDDFHSFTSQEDITLLPVISNASPDAGKQKLEDDVTPLQLPQSKFLTSVLTSTLHNFTSQEDDTLSDAVPSKVSTIPSAYSSSKMPDPAMNGVFASTPSGSRLSNSSASAHPPSTSSRRSSSSEGSCSDGSVIFRKSESDRESTHSNYSGLNYAGVCNLIARLGNGTISQQSLPSTRPQNLPQVNNARQILRRRLEHEYDDHRNNAFPLSQPDGTNPWTLSLEPTLTSTESSMASQSSTTSLSNESSDATDDETTPRRYFPSTFVSSQSRSFIQPHSFNSSRANATHDTEVSTTRQGSNNSIYALPLAQEFIPMPVSPFRPIEEPPRPRNVVQKTKEFCNKFKKFLVPKKASKQRDVKGMMYDYPLSDDMFRMDVNMQSPIFPLLPPIPRETSPWSFVRRRREPKMSLPSSLPHSEYRSERIVKNSTTSVDKHSYEYHARPKTLEEIRSKRRFSLPVFSGPPASQPSGSAGHISSTLSRDHRRPFTSSINSASQNDSLLMSTLT